MTCYYGTCCMQGGGGGAGVWYKTDRWTAQLPLYQLPVQALSLATLSLADGHTLSPEETGTHMYTCTQTALV